MLYRSVLLVCASGVVAQTTFRDATMSSGLGDLRAARVAFADLDGDRRPDAIIDRTRVFMNRSTDEGVTFEEIESGLPTVFRNDVVVFADMDGDGDLDAVLSRYLDVQADGFEAPSAMPLQSAWIEANGDGTFGKAHVFDEATPATTIAVAIGDVDLDGRLDVAFGNAYTRYGASYEGYRNDILVQRDEGDFHRLAMPSDDLPFDPDADEGGRPTYGIMIADLVEDETPEVLECSYGRRWNRVWTKFWETDEGDLEYEDLADVLGIAGDDIDHGRYPEWLKERAKTDPRFDRADEPYFRANGNTFDAAVGDIDNDGDFDLFLAEITHGWAGESSDRSRFLVNTPLDEETLETFVQSGHEETPDRSAQFSFWPSKSVDRVPADPTAHRWNQGDLFAALADFDHDGRLDLLLCSSEYPDDQRLRLYRQQEDGSFVDIAPWANLDHVGAAQPSLADVDGDGDLDILVGQSFNRMRKEQREGREPRVRLFLNDSTERSGLVLRLEGDPARGVNTHAIGAVVEIACGDLIQTRQLVGPGGHAGKMHDAIIHAPVVGTTHATVTVRWPCDPPVIQTFEGLAPGTHVLKMQE